MRGRGEMVKTLLEKGAATEAKTDVRKPSQDSLQRIRTNSSQRSCTCTIQSEQRHLHREQHVVLSAVPLQPLLCPRPPLHTALSLPLCRTVQLRCTMRRSMGT